MRESSNLWQSFACKLYLKRIQIREIWGFITLSDYKDIHNHSFPWYPYAFDAPPPEMIKKAMDRVKRVEKMRLASLVVLHIGVPQQCKSTLLVWNVLQLFNTCFGAYGISPQEAWSFPRYHWIRWVDAANLYSKVRARSHKSEVQIIISEEARVRDKRLYLWHYY